MSLYNMINGVHPLAGDLLAILGWDTPEKRQDIPRLRDAMLFPNEIRVLTRTGGNNREDYDNSALTSHDAYLRDWDDSYDNTFAWWSYEWPEEWKEQLQMLLETIQESRPDLLPESLEEITNRAFERIQASK